MFRQVRYQTGELSEVTDDMRKGMIPCMDVDNSDEFNWVVTQLANMGIHRAEPIPLDRDARDRVKEPEFEFRAAFHDGPVKAWDEVDKSRLMYIDFYSEPFVDRDYDPVGEL